MRKLLHTLEPLLRALAFLVIGCFLGILYARDNPSLQMALTAALSVYDGYVERYNPKWWQPAPGPETGVTAYDPSRTQDGLTLYISPELLVARLIDMHGRERHRWQIDSDMIADAGSDGLFGPEKLFWNTAHLYPNGDLLAVLVRDWTPYGHRLLKLDRDSNLLWVVPINAHHDISVDGDGRIYTLGQRIRETAIAGWPQIATPFIEDTVVRLDADGRMESEVSVVDAFARSIYAHYLALHPVDERGDILHVNQAEVITPAQAATLPFAEAGQVLISMREIHAIAILDVEEGRVVWATFGPWRFQHDPNILDNGNLLLFDNRGDVGPTGASRVIEYDPRTRAVTWLYAGTAKEPLHSIVRSDAKRLSNGNTLITESDGGRIIEVTPEGDVVWQFINPARSDDGKLISVIGLDVMRFDEAALPFLAASE